MLFVILSLIAGGGLLLVGAELLVRGASRLAGRLGIAPLIIGLTIVAYGTSAPELAVSVQSSLNGQGGIALGNVIGSNIFNVLVILGLSSLVAPLPVAQQLIRLDVPILIGVSALVLMFSLDQQIQPSDGLILIAGGIIYTLFLVYQSRRESNAEVQGEYDREYGHKSQGRWGWAIDSVLMLGGLFTLVQGSRLFVSGAVAIATLLGVSETVIGLTIVAAGTSLPELATSAVATFKGERDIAVGNVIGSNIFNILTVLGVTALSSGSAGILVPSAVLHFDIPIMVAVALACLPIFVTGNLISRWEGTLFMAYYVAYTAFLILRSAQHDHLQVFNQVMLLFVLPITLLTLGGVGFQARRAADPPYNDDKPSANLPTDTHPR